MRVPKLARWAALVAVLLLAILRPNAAAALLLAAIALSAHVALRLLALCVDKHGLEEARYSSLGEKAFGKLGSTAAMVAVALQQLGPCVIYIQM